MLGYLKSFSRSISRALFSLFDLGVKKIFNFLSWHLLCFHFATYSPISRTKHVSSSLHSILVSTCKSVYQGQSNVNLAATRFAHDIHIFQLSQIIWESPRYI